MFSAFDAYVGRSLDLYGEWSESEVEIWSGIIREGDHVLDVGANIGAFSVALGKLVGSAGKVTAFEMDPTNFLLLSTNIALNELDQISVCNEAMGSKSGVEIEVANVDDKNWAGHYADPNPGSRSLLQKQPSTASSSTVKQVSIDSLELKKCAFIKIDVEGMELQVLQGANETIRRLMPILYLENDRYDMQVVALLTAMNYECYFHTPPLFNPRNFRSEAKNVFNSTVSVNLMCQYEGGERTLPASYKPPQSLRVLPRMGVNEQKFVQMKTAVAMRPHDAAALEAVGSFLMQREEPGAAASALLLFERAIEITQAVMAEGETAVGKYKTYVPVSSDGYHNAGVLLHTTKRTAEAIKQYEGAVTISPTRTDSMNNLAAAMKAEGRLPEAIRVYERAIAVRPDYDKAHFNLAIVYETQAKELLAKGGAEGSQGMQESGRLQQLADKHYQLAQKLMPPAGSNRAQCVTPGLCNST
jgi:FkbM family methyltransferase